MITTFNGAETIGEQLDALGMQDWKGSLEVVVSDNGSTDETLAVVDRYAKRFRSLTASILGCAGCVARPERRSISGNW